MTTRELWGRLRRGGPGVGARRLAVGAGVGLVGGAWWLFGARRRHRVAQRLRYLRGRARGFGYRALGGHPSEQVDDDLLAQRVRSVLGRITKDLDLPHVQVSVTRHVVLLHGQVGTDEEADGIEKAAHRVDGVDGVLSYLHVGLRPGVTRPSEGEQAYTPSAALRRLQEAAVSAGAPEPVAGAAVRAVLATFLERLPREAREHLLGHLPRDVHVLATPPRRRGSVAHLRRVDDLVDAVLAADHMDPTRVREVTAAVLAALRDLVPEENRHVAAALPAELRAFWFAAPLVKSARAGG